MTRNKIIILMTFLIFLSLIFNGCINEEIIVDKIENIVIEGKGNFITIQSAINNASNGDIIFVYNGTYNEMIHINKSISLVSIYKNSTIIYNNNDSSISFIKIKRGNCVIDGFTIIGDNESRKSKGIEISSTNTTVENNIITNLTIQYMDYGIHITNSNNNIVSKNILKNNNNGLLLSKSNNNIIVFNNFSKNKIYGLYLSYQSNNNQFNNNIISNNSNGLRIKDSQKNTFEKNIIINNNERGIYTCCGAINNLFYNNSLINNYPNSDDIYNNKWYFNNIGNYWHDYVDKYPDASDVNFDGIWDIPYQIYRETKDLYPLVVPIDIY